jgi:hypothetical protein
MGLLRMFQRRKLRTAFGDYLSPEVIRRLLTRPDLVRPTVKHFQFVVVVFEEANPQEISALMTDVVGTLFEHKATVTSVSPAFLVGLLGVPFPDGNSPEARRAVVESLLRGNGSRIRIAHGECDALVGNLGGPLRYTYDAAIPGFLGILRKLLDADPGSAFEVSQVGSS